MDCLVLKKAPEGGYMVHEMDRGGGFNYPPLTFASTTIDESLKFIKSKLEPRAK